ncbi:ImmA/IrrE family metallo-endopeptidase [Vibrio vulnificus]|nr:ImmA/IrrE family metallo-endopeptidase [Vibrio vulnificus]
MFSVDSMVERLVAYRVLKEVNQEELAKAMGFNARQTLSSIEKYERTLKPEELLKALDYLNVDFEEFVDPYSLVGEAVYSWRQTDSSLDTLESFEVDTNRVVALYRDLHKEFSTKKSSVLLPKIGIKKTSSFVDAENIGQSLADELELGDYPAERLESQLFNRFNIATLYLDMPSSVSGAATKLNDMFVILANRNEVIGRRNFDIAHETFHCLTWDAIPPAYIEKAYSSTSKPHEEKLADTFASALLMPKNNIEKHFSNSFESINEDSINVLATKFGVSSQAMKWRLKSLKKLTNKEVGSLDDSLLTNNGDLVSLETPKLYNSQFVDYLYKAIDTGYLSVRKISSTLKMSIDELSSLFRDYGKDSPFDL